MASSDLVFIYALCEPNTRVVRYIGKAQNLSARLRKHRQTALRRKTHLACWLKSLMSGGQFAEIVPIRQVPRSCWQEAEKNFIRIARSLGMPLVNATDGGDGVTMTTETRAKIGAANSRPLRPEEQIRRAGVLRENLKALPGSPRSGTGRFDSEQIKRLHNEGLTQTQIAEVIGTYQGTISMILRFGKSSTRKKGSPCPSES